VALTFILADQRNAVPAVLSGAAAIPREPAKVIELAPLVDVPTPTNPAGEETELWFATAPLKWRGIDGHQHFAQRWSDVRLPKRLVNRASQRNCIVPITDPKRRDHRDILNGLTTSSARAIDLDAERLPPSTDLPPGFERLDRGPARTLSISIKPATGTATEPV
jgi:hypothetical protein